MKGLSLILSILGLAIAPIVAQVCPPPQALLPCTCDEQYMSIKCEKIEEEFNLKEVFDRASEHINDNLTFHSLTISSTSISEIEEGAVEHFKFTDVYITDNLNLEYISPRAFNATRNITYELYLDGNNLRNDAPNETGFFDVVQGFEGIWKVEAQNNHLTSIPDNPFQNLSRLEFVDFSNNSISHIGSRAFATLSNNLWIIDLPHNSIPSEGLAEDAFDGISNRAYVNLQCNPYMEFMEHKSFQTLLERAERVWVGGRCGSGPRDPPQMFYCDERVDWICEYEPRFGWLIGYLCNNQTGFEDIFEYCTGRHGTTVAPLEVRLGN